MLKKRPLKKFPNHPTSLSKKMEVESRNLQGLEFTEQDSKLEQLVKNTALMKLLSDMCLSGASVGTLAGKMRVSPTTLQEWILKGRAELVGVEEDVPDSLLSPYARLWRILSESWSDARLLAEAMLREKNPERYLQSKTAQLLGDDWVDSKVQEDETEHQLEIGSQLLDALKNLRKQGFDLNEIIDSDSMTLITATPKPKEVDILKANGIELKRHPSLPNRLSELAENAELLLAPE